MNTKKIKIIALFLPLIIAGCGGRKKSASQKKVLRKNIIKKISHLDSKTCDFETTKNNITVRAKKLKTIGEHIDEFGENGKYLLRGKRLKVIPIKITVENKSDQTYKTLPKYSPLKSLKTNKVLSKLRSNSLGGAFLTSAKFFGAAAISGILGETSLAMATTRNIPLLIIPAIPFLLATTTLTIAALIAPAIHAVKITNKNKNISRFIKHYVWSDKKTVKPSETKTFYIFVRPRNYEEKFALFFTNKNKEQLSFNIKLSEL